MVHRTLCVLSVVFSAVTGYAVAQEVNIVCGADRYILDTSKDSLRTDGKVFSVDWRYDGEWIRLQFSNGSKLAFSSKNGYLLQGRKQINSDCRFLNRSVLKSLPKTKTSNLRLAFLDLPEAVRKQIQTHLENTGHYASTIDGLWGSGTENALLAYLYDINDDSEESYDYREIQQANNFLKSFLTDSMSARTSPSAETISEQQGLEMAPKQSERLAQGFLQQ